jgi:hypothetical protein
MRCEPAVPAAVLGMVVQGGEDDPLGCCCRRFGFGLRRAGRVVCGRGFDLRVRFAEGNMGELLPSTAGGLQPEATALTNSGIPRAQDSRYLTVTICVSLLAKNGPVGITHRTIGLSC